ncbi:7279_t:CDS:2, partial [Racocetra persica]
QKQQKNSNGSGYRQVLFACEKQRSYNGKKEHSHEIYLDARKFSSNMRKFDQDKLDTIEKLHDTGLRTKDIYV